jgi:hypothetical protein
MTAPAGAAPGDVPAHLIDIEAVPYLGCGACDVAVTRANSGAALGSPVTAVGWPAGKLAMFGLGAESGHISAVAMSLVSRLGELPCDKLTLKNPACDWRGSARSNEPLPAR